MTAELLPNYYGSVPDRGGRNLYELWEDRIPFGDSITPSGFSPDYVAHILAIVLENAAKGSRIVSLGSGNGFVEALLHANGYEVLCVDHNEDAVAITRSYRIRLWLFAQDLAQLEGVYPKWRSLVANCRGQIFFRPNDTRTAEHVAERLGRRKDIWGGEDWVASPQQLMGPEFRDDCVIFQDGLSIRANLYPPYYANEKLTEWVAQKKRELGDTVYRAPRPEKTLVFEPDDDQATDADLADDPEYQAELAALQARMRGRKNGSPPDPKDRALPRPA